MSARTLATSYEHNAFEDRIYAFWKERGYFRPPEPSEIADDDQHSPFVIVIPPPNVTGVLHMGHGLNNSLQDILVRYHRMKGRPSLWVPGTDHAGIATQNVVERMLQESGSSRHAIGRERFVEKTWQVKREHHAVITHQLEKIGASCDWTRERFTLDEGLSKAVREIFVSLYQQNLIYRGNYLINWCSHHGTALSDDEVVHQEIEGRLYRYSYPLEAGGLIDIATTRPETMLGDTAVAVHPDDPRYANLIGTYAIVPLTERRIPIIADRHVDQNFGSGAVKITPGHDPNDWEIGQRHGLPIINILNPDGTLNEHVPQRYRGMTIRDARRRVIDELMRDNLFRGVDKHRHQVGHCYRCNTIIEPYLSEQWFVRMRPLAERALQAWKQGEVRFYPAHWEKTYVEWLTNIRDWCISRQLWWGHRIPVWYDRDTGEMIVSREDPTTLPKYQGRNLQQDEDVLDTWFSSWLWPFSTLGWPQQSVDLKRFFPTSTLVTGYDIIFFWVARMIMASLYALDRVPFRDVYLTGLIRDKKGRKMSKSLGNGIDPLEIVEHFGADALKFSLAYLTTSSQDILLDRDDFQVGSRFANKIWNAARLIFLSAEGRTLLPSTEIVYDDIDRWIEHRLDWAIGEVDRAMQAYRFSDACHAIYEYVWNDFCDWYLEIQKHALRTSDDKGKDRIATLLIHLLAETLRLIHPFLSFISEELYQTLIHEHLGYGTENANDIIDVADSVMIAPYPHVDARRNDPQLAQSFAALQELVRTIRTMRSEFSIAPHARFPVLLHMEPDFAAADLLRRHLDTIANLTGASDIDVDPDGKPSPSMISLVGVGFEVHVAIGDYVDPHDLRRRFGKKCDRFRSLLQATDAKLHNQAFLDKANATVIAREREKAEEFTRQISLYQRYIVALVSADSSVSD